MIQDQHIFLDFLSQSCFFDCMKKCRLATALSVVFLYSAAFVAAFLAVASFLAASSSAAISTHSIHCNYFPNKFPLFFIYLLFGLFFLGVSPALFIKKRENRCAQDILLLRGESFLEGFPGVAPAPPAFLLGELKLPRPDLLLFNVLPEFAACK